MKLGAQEKALPESKERVLLATKAPGEGKERGRSTSAKTEKKGQTAKERWRKERKDGNHLPGGRPEVAAEKVLVMRPEAGRPKNDDQCVWVLKL